MTEDHGTAKPYLSRIVDAELDDLLQASGAVLIEGPRACGKTETGRRKAASEVRLDVDVEARAAASLDPRLILAGARPRLIDEWQIEPAVWNHVRRAVDDAHAPGQFILTGSSVPADDIVRHTGAGRITRLRMRPMSLFESGRATGEVSMARLLDGEGARATDAGLSITELAELLCVGGWPALLGAEPRRALRAVLGYVDEIRRADVPRLAGPRRDPERVGRVMRSLARHSASQAAVRTIAADAGGPDGSLDDDSVRAYLDALRRLFVTEDQPAWAPHLRSRSSLRVAKKRHFVDPSIAVAALRATPSRLLRDLNLLGLLFESMVVRDLRIYAQPSLGTIHHYRDNTGLEVDCIVELGDGRWAAFEVKLGTRQVDDGAATLLRLADRIDTAIMGAPVTLGVIVPTGYSYRRPDGVSVIAIGTLGP
jgi:hypothetical protein